MKINASSYMLIVILMIGILITLWPLFTMEGLESKLLPIVFGIIACLLSALGLWQETRKQKKLEEGVKKDKGEAKAPWRRSMVNFGWVLGFLLGIYLLGFVIAIAIFVLSYMKWLGTRWLTAVIWAVSSSVVIYFAFEVGLQLSLFRGLLPTLLSR